MIGIDLSLPPITWAALSGRGLIHGALERPDPGLLGTALSAAGVRDREIAISVPTRDVRIGLLPKGLSGARVRRAAALAASQQLRIAPDAVAASLDVRADGATYVAAPREAVAGWAAPWRAARWRVLVVEPAAIALLRGAGGDATELFVRTGAGAIEIVVGSRSRWVLGRTIEFDWQSNIASARVEVEDTIALARKSGAEIAGIVAGGAGEAGVLADAMSGLGPVRPLLLQGAADAASVPPAAIVAASMARWASARRAAPNAVSRSAGILSRIRRRRPTHAA